VSEGVAMLVGSVAGGFIAQHTNLGVPYVIRAIVLGITFIAAFILMRDAGFEPKRGRNPIEETKRIFRDSLRHGLGNPAIRWVMLASPFTDGVSIYAFYAMQPYLLELYGTKGAYGIAGLAAAIVAGAQIIGGLLVPRVAHLFRRRTSVLLSATVTSAAILALIGAIPNFWAAVALLVIWGLTFAMVAPVRQAYLNGLIESERRATILSFDSLLGSAGGVVAQPLLGRAADVWSYPVSYACGAAIQALAIPFLWLARREGAVSDDAS
jgi:MFS family permease